MPVLIINLILPPHYYDINLSTDKKQILLFKEEVLLAAFQEIFRQAVDTSNANVHIISGLASSKQNDDNRSSSSSKKAAKKVDERREELVGGKMSGIQTRSLEEVYEISKPRTSTSTIPPPVTNNLISSSLSSLSSPIETQSKPSSIETLPISVGNSSLPAESIPVVVDRCRKSKKRRDPLPDNAPLSASTLNSTPHTSDLVESERDGLFRMDVTNGEQRRLNRGYRQQEQQQVIRLDEVIPSKRRELSNTEPVKQITSTPILSIPSSTSTTPSLPPPKSSVTPSQSSLPSSMSSILTMVSSSDFSQPSNISQHAILSQFEALLQHAPNTLQSMGIVDLESDSLRGTQQGHEREKKEENHGIEESGAIAEVELSRVLSKVR